MHNLESRFPYVAVARLGIALVDAFDWMLAKGKIKRSPVRRRVAGVSVGVVRGEPRLDLDYSEDVAADVDMNVVMSSEGRFVEVQGTGEHGTFDRDELDAGSDPADPLALEHLDLEPQLVAGAHRAISPVVHSYLLWLSAIAAMQRPAWIAGLLLFYAVFVLTMNVRPEKSQI